MKGFPRRERIPFPPLHTICLYKTLLYYCDILPVPRRQRQSLSRSPPSGIHPAAVSFSLMGISPPRSRPGTLVQVSSFLPPVIATVGCCPRWSDSRPTARRSLGNGSAVPDQLVFNCQRSVLRNRLRKIRLPGATLCNACPIWSRRLFECLENSLHDDLFFCRQHLGYLFK